MREKAYIAIDLKSFYASVECIQRHLDPLTTNLVVADRSRTEKTICLAVTPALKAFGIPGRARLFEVVQKVSQVNALRKSLAPGHKLTGSSIHAQELQNHPELAVDYLVAPPHMGLYMETSAAIYQIYMKYVSPEDIHVYSVDEVFIDATPYLATYQLDAPGFARMLIQDIYTTFGITATAGVGTNLYLCKVAMDIMAKRTAPDENGVRIAQLDEMSYRKLLWDHTPLTDFWRVGPGYTRRLEKIGLHTMGDIARCSLGGETDFHNQELLYRTFGIHAELLIDHAWGWESCTIQDIKSYRPATNCLSSGQVLTCPYTAEKARLVLREMADMLSLDLVDKGLTTNQIVITVGYDIENLTDPTRRAAYHGAVTTDFYGRKVPRHAHGTGNFPGHTASSKEIIHCAGELFDSIVDPNLLIRRLNITANHVIPETAIPDKSQWQQMDLFAGTQDPGPDPQDPEKEKRMQHAVLEIRRKFGKNAILRGMNFEEGATARDRNAQIGGHKA